MKRKLKKNVRRGVTFVPQKKPKKKITKNSSLCLDLQAKRFSAKRDTQKSTAQKRIMTIQ